MKISQEDVDKGMNVELWRGKLEAYKEMRVFCDSIIQVLEVAVKTSEAMKGAKK